MTKYDPRKNAEGYNDPTPYAAEKHMMAQIRGKQARVAGGYFENIISASCDYYLSRGLAKIEKTPEPMKPLGAKNRKGQFLACYARAFHTSTRDLGERRLTDFLTEYGEAVEEAKRLQASRPTRAASFKKPHIRRR